MNTEELEKTKMELKKIKKDNDKKIDLYDERTRMGKFYTDEEYEQRRDDVLSRTLPGGEEKGPRLIRKKKTSRQTDK